MLDLMEGFKECQYTVIPRGKNFKVDSLAVSTSIFQVPKHTKDHFQIEVRYRPSIPNNVEHWQIFEDDE